MGESRSGQAPALSFETALITERRLDRGSIVFVAGSFAELLAGECDAHKLFRSLLSVRTAGSNEDMAEYQPIFHNLVLDVGFAGIGGLFLLLALVFTGVYVLGSTWGAWMFLHRKGWSKHNWSAFAACAALATVVSLVAVQATRGWGKRVEQVAVVDAEANSRFGRAACYFGLKTSTDSLYDVWLPENYALSPEPAETDNYLKSLPESAGIEAFEQSFTDPVRYHSQPSQALLKDVRFRATVKQFEGRWQGEMPGWLEATDVTTARGTSPKESVKQLSPTSQAEQELEIDPDEADLLRTVDIQLRGKLTNHFRFPLQGCFIIHAARPVYDGALDIETQRQAQTYVHQIGNFPSGATVDLANLYLEPNRAGRSDALTFDEWKEHTLTKMLDEVGRKFVGLTAGGAPWHNTLIAATAASDGPNIAKWQGLGGNGRVGRARLRSLDMSDRLDPSTALLVGFVESGPEAEEMIQLCTRSGTGVFRPVPVSKSRSMYRFLIPIE